MKPALHIVTPDEAPAPLPEIARPHPAYTREISAHLGLALAYVLERAEPDPFGGCWLWWPALNAAGYGLSQGFRSGRTSIKLAHRLSFLAAGRNIPDGLVLDHRCRVRSCVNPAHLRAVTRAVNNTENSLGIGAVNAAKTHCKRGHPLFGDNMEIRGGGRHCLTCRELHRVAYARPSRSTGVGRPFGEGHASSKLTSAEVAEIRVAADGSYREIGARFGVTSSTVFKIKQGRTWRQPEHAS